jgi:protein SEY1
MAQAAPVDTALMQVVDYEENFLRGAEPFLKRTGVAARGFDYNVVAIMGPQSSGKSTLMNMLFGTKFTTMEADAGRYQVTQGVWMGSDAEARIVVMDNEGCDSRERGEEGASFERKSALFVLALAEVLIVNVWTQDVGRFNAANLSLLKTVMELDLQLFFGGPSAPDAAGRQRMHKTRLLFVLRDHYAVEVGGTPVARLSAILTEDVNNIWRSISKPDAAKGTAVADYFDLDFFALPHKVLAPDAFAAAGAELKRQFRDGELFRSDYSRGVAADGFAAFAESVWETVRANKELDIPSQKEMLAHVRCEQIAREASEGVEKALTPLREALLPAGGGKAEAVSGLYATMLAAVDAALQEYGEAAGRYSAPVAAMKAKDLHAKLGGACKALYDAQATAASDDALVKFRRAIGDAQNRAKPWSEWGARSQRAHSAALELFDEKCEAGSLPAEAMPPTASPHPMSFVKASCATARKRLEASLAEELARASRDVTAKARAGCVKLFQDSFKAPLSTVLDSADEDVWERASEVASVAWEKAAAHAADVYGAEGLDFAEDELEAAVEDDLKPDCYERAVKTSKEVIGTQANFLLRMQKRFDDKFRFDERGVPRHFGPDEDLETLFVAAREHGEQLAGLLAEVKLGGVLPRLRATARAVDADTVNAVIFEEHSCVDLREKLRRQAGAVFVEAKRAQEASKITTKIPAWLFALLIIFGWNEIMMVLKSPLLLLLTVVVAPALYVGWTLDAPTMLGPAIHTLAMPYVRQARDLIDTYVPHEEADAPAATAAAAARTQ